MMLKSAGFFCLAFCEIGIGMTLFDKPALDVPAQLKLWQGRGLVVEDELRREKGSEGRKGQVFLCHSYRNITHSFSLSR